MGGISAALEFSARAAPHDLRRTGATRLSAEGVAPFIISQVLGHSSDGGGGAAVTRAHYNLHRYTQEKRGALLLWEGLLMRVVGERQPAGSGGEYTAQEFPEDH
jgi:integrase